MVGPAPLGLAYLSVLHADPASDLIQGLRRAIGGTFIVHSGCPSAPARDEAAYVVKRDPDDMVAVGRPTIAYSDLVTRWE